MSGLWILLGALYWTGLMLFLASRRQSPRPKIQLSDTVMLADLQESNRRLAERVSRLEARVNEMRTILGLR